MRAATQQCNVQVHNADKQKKGERVRGGGWCPGARQAAGAVAPWAQGQKRAQRRGARGPALSPPLHVHVHRGKHTAAPWCHQSLPTPGLTPGRAWVPSSNGSATVTSRWERLAFAQVLVPGLPAALGHKPPAPPPCGQEPPEHAAHGEVPAGEAQQAGARLSSQGATSLRTHARTRASACGRTQQGGVPEQRSAPPPPPATLEVGAVALHAADARDEPGRHHRGVLCQDVDHAGCGAGGAQRAWAHLHQNCPRAPGPPPCAAAAHATAGACGGTAPTRHHCARLAGRQGRAPERGLSA